MRSRTRPHSLRLATKQDATQVQAIYAPVVRDTPISFEWEPPSTEEMRRRIVRTTEANLPWIVCDRAGEVLGYAYAARHRERAAYQWSVEVSVYVQAEARRAGLGRALYTSLFAVLALQDFCGLYAGATLPNPASVRLHESMGFQRVGIFHSVGYKLGGWHDVIWWERPLGERPAHPQSALTLAEAQAREGWGAALTAGESLIRL